MKNNRNFSIACLLLRFAVGGLMLFHGIHKLLHGFEGIKFLLKQANLPEWLWIGVPVGEVIAPILIVLGVYTRVSSALVAFTMLLSMYLAYGWHSFDISAVGGLKAELNILFLLAAIAIMLLGHGKYAIQKKDKGFWS